MVSSVENLLEVKKCQQKDTTTFWRHFETAEEIFLDTLTLSSSYEFFVQGQDYSQFRRLVSISLSF